MTEQVPLHGLVVEPGDTVIVAYQQMLTEAEIMRIRTQWERCVGGVKLAILHGVAGVAVQRRTDASDTGTFGVWSDLEAEQGPTMSVDALGGRGGSILAGQEP